MMIKIIIIYMLLDNVFLAWLYLSCPEFVFQKFWMFSGLIVSVDFNI